MFLNFSILLAGATIVLALPALAMRRAGPWPTRLCALVAMLGIGFAVLDLHRETLVHVLPHLAVVPTASLDPAARQEIRGAVGERVEVHVEGGAEALAHRLARARLRHDRDPRLVILWSGRFPVDKGSPLPSTPATVLSPSPVTPLDPELIEVRQVSSLAAGRPGAFEVCLGSDAAKRTDLRGHLRVVDDTGAVVCDQELAGKAIERVEFPPARPGTHAVHLSLSTAGITLRGSGAVEVAPAPRVTVVGAQAATLANALEVQGLAVTSAAHLPHELSGTLVLLEPLANGDQTRVREFLLDGGGLFLVGAARGGAVPDADEPLAGVSPVVRLPLPESPTAKPREHEQQSPGDQPDKSQPDETQPDKLEPKKGDNAATGDTKGAKLTRKKMEVTRRSIAMVLLIDRSGSMDQHVGGGNTRMDLAKESARQTARALDEDDLLAIVSFGEEKQARIVLAPVRVTETAVIAKALASLRAVARATYIADGLNQARSLLSKIDAGIKYVVVITDGELFDARENFTMVAAAKYRRAGITLCVVQILAPDSHPAADATTSASRLAQQGNGYLIQQKNFARVPKVISTEVQKMRTRAGRPPRKPNPAQQPDPAQQPTDPDANPPPDTPPPPPPPQPGPTATGLLRVNVAEDSPLLEPQSSGFPGVAGVLPARARTDARTLLTAGDDGIPLLAFANRGLGRIGVWTADLLGPWGEAWLADPVFPSRLAKWVRHLTPPVATPRETTVLRRPTSPPSRPLPREVAFLEALGGTTLRPVDTFVPPAPTIHTEIEGLAGEHARYGLLLLALLAGIEFLLLRRPRRSA